MQRLCSAGGSAASITLLILDRNYLRTYIHKHNYCVVIKFRVLAESRLNGDPHPRTRHK